MLLFATVHKKYQPRFQAGDWKAIVALGSSPKNADTSTAELALFQENLKKLAEEKRFLGNKPLVVISAGHLARPSGISQERWNGYLQIVQELQKNLLKLSTESRQVIVKESDHMIHYNHPQTIVSVIQELVKNPTPGQ